MHSVDFDEQRRNALGKVLTEKDIRSLETRNSSTRERYRNATIQATTWGGRAHMMKLSLGEQDRSHDYAKRTYGDRINNMNTTCLILASSVLNDRSPATFAEALAIMKDKKHDFAKNALLALELPVDSKNVEHITRTAFIYYLRMKD